MKKQLPAPYLTAISEPPKTRKTPQNRLTFCAFEEISQQKTKKFPKKMEKKRKNFSLFNQENRPLKKSRALNPAQTLEMAPETTTNEKPRWELAQPKPTKWKIQIKNSLLSI